MLSEHPVESRLRPGNNRNTPKFYTVVEPNSERMWSMETDQSGLPQAPETHSRFISRKNVEVAVLMVSEMSVNRNATVPNI